MDLNDSQEKSFAMSVHCKTEMKRVKSIEPTLFTITTKKPPAFMARRNTSQSPAKHNPLTNKDLSAKVEKSMSSLAS